MQKLEQPFLEHVIRMHELRMQAAASMYDLSDKKGRNQSAKALAELFFGLTKVTSPELFIEAGAKEASASLRARQLLPKARVVAFEANPYNHKLYTAKRPFEKSRVEYLNKAVTKDSGSITFNIRRSIGDEEISPYTGQSSLLKRTDPSTKYEEVTVESTSLDAMFPDAPTSSMWIDVEGATSDLIAGGQKVLSNASVAIVEMSDKPHWDGEWLAAKVIEEFMKVGMSPVARDFEYIAQYNVVFVRDELLKDHQVRSNIQYFYSNLAKRDYSIA